jgi:hypothetical protein
MVYGEISGGPALSEYVFNYHSALVIVSQMQD